ncbi:glyoxalase-like domain protein [Synechococcales cyanobacterium C]|uniref:Glyoxalase-like domain protein n=1 Tax=Petrachloros mirabilis ULC683 TaxID=2781853 RepID=A0A8K1ZZ05_9CYAN|nr:glyoxalase-like domain protein [Petrachloros mirabilis]NCJ07769.1 glyoxalase-like domain protein [Petrachloros mirabilis ULC683]
MTPLITLIPESMTTAAFWPLLPLDGLFSTQGVMVMLLVAYAGAMWMFLSSAPKVYTLMVSDLDIARQFFESDLQLSVAEVPLHYYYNYEQTLGLSGVDPIYMGAGLGTTATRNMGAADGLWYQLKKNVQLHIIPGASIGEKNRQRHVSFDHDCLDQILSRIQTRYVKYKIRRDTPLNFLAKTYAGEVIEFSEVSN